LSKIVYETTTLTLFDLSGSAGFYEPIPAVSRLQREMVARGETLEEGVCYGFRIMKNMPFRAV
jgi:hypothetical protein